MLVAMLARMEEAQTETSQGEVMLAGKFRFPEVHW